MRSWAAICITWGGAVACGGSGQQPHIERITIPRGASVVAVAETLSAHGIIDDPSFFRFYTALSGKARHIKAGTFELPQDAGIRRSLAALVAGQPAQHSLFVAEGLMLSEIAIAVERQIGIPSEELIAAARDSALRTRVGAGTATLEGYLYPSTYLVRLDATPREVVLQMLGEFEARWRDEWNARLDTLVMSRHEIVTLASIIEGEVRHEADRRFVSSVYHNRLSRGMRLQADPTVIYTLGRRRRLFAKDYERPSPYNTYLIDGLPPGPVGSPAQASIEAALYPERTDFLYFVARADGQHVFSRTYAEHRRAIAEIRSRG